MITLGLMRIYNMGVLGRLFGTDKAIENIMDKDNGLITQVGQWWGNKEYTEQEQANDDKEKRKWALRQLEALEPFKITQRILAFTTCGLWALLATVYMLSIFLAESETQEALWLLLSSNYILYPSMSVFSLYFGGGVISSFKGNKKR